MSVAIGIIILAAVVGAYSGSLKVFKDVKSISENIDTKTPSIELLARYFDRWGVGVVSRAATEDNKTTCANCPAFRKYISVTDTTPCDDITFYGNLYGIGFVQNVASGAANVVSCRLSKDTNKNCYYLWRNNAVQNDYDGSNNLIPLGLASNLSVNNADCSALSAGATYNATVDDDLSPYTGSVFKTVQAGDIIQRTPHSIRLYCSQNPNDNNNQWLYVDLSETVSDCSEEDTPTPIAPVDSFQVSLLPSGCSGTGGTCTAAQVNVTFRSQSQKYKAGQYDTYDVTRVFGR
ncbi:MAG: hypothetical protein K8I29_11535 [Alphaproteobacteria bacterium]|uniref:Uncharacterized protein n=1 Tax=Candidatus Nitrobium versatile TaxID=2884831 RepID=A0A953M1K9_9BACT|nr:hypothetical protein [Candidatus Nitrobium versatile]